MRSAGLTGFGWTAPSTSPTRPAARVARSITTAARRRPSRRRGVAASRRLIEHRAVRFPTPIRAAPVRPPGGTAALRLSEAEAQPREADRIPGCWPAAGGATSFDATDEEKAAGEGIEAERRPAYVAFTRAQRELVVSTAEAAASRFLTEAGLEPTRRTSPPAPAGGRQPVRGGARAEPNRSGPSSTTRKSPARDPGAASAGLAEARRVKLPTRCARHRREARRWSSPPRPSSSGPIGPIMTSERMTVAKLLDGIEHLGAPDRTAVLDKGARRARAGTGGAPGTSRDAPRSGSCGGSHVRARGP